MTEKKVETKDDIIKGCLKLLFPEDQKTFEFERINHALFKLNNIDLYSIRERLKKICKT